MNSRIIMEKIKIKEVPNKEFILSIFNNFVKQNYGQFVYIDPSSLQYEDNTYFIIGGVSTPYYVEEAGSEFPHLRFNTFKDVLSIEMELKQNSILVTGISRNKLKEIIKKQEANRRKTLEYALLKVANDKFSKIPLIQVQHNPLLEILKLMDNIVEKKQILGVSEKIKWSKYLKLLHDLDIITYVGSEITYGQMYKEFEKRIISVENKDKSELVNAIFNYVLDAGTDYLTEYLHLTSTMPYLRSSATYYIKALKINKPITMSKDFLLQSYRDLYRLNPKQYKFYNWIDNLCDYDILKKEKEGISGNEEIFEKIEKINLQY
ncbi:MAG: hypothetical protein ACP5IB_09790 [Thermoplasmata archaeon]